LSILSFNVHSYKFVRLPSRFVPSFVYVTFFFQVSYLRKKKKKTVLMQILTDAYCRRDMKELFCVSCQATVRRHLAGPMTFRIELLVFEFLTYSRPHTPPPRRHEDATYIFTFKYLT